MFTKTFTLNTGREDLHKVTTLVEDAVRESGLADGFCLVYCPHTTAGITINENADPDVVHDLLIGLRAAFPDRPDFRHSEGNSSAHLRATAVGSSATVPISGGKLLLGTWQEIYFCEFDGPRTRKFIVSVM
jgi:secondary thiamine-phosphate synthase enzyme